MLSGASCVALTMRKKWVLKNPANFDCLFVLMPMLLSYCCYACMMVVLIDNHSQGAMFYLI